MQNICNLIGWNSVHISDIFNCKYQWNVKRKKARQDIQNIWIYTNLKHTWYMCKYRVKQDLIVLKSKVLKCFNQ